jgi:antitoxin ParD1/3/4
MKSFNITMPEELLAYVRDRTRQGGFGTPTEFMRHLIRNDQEDRSRIISFQLMERSRELLGTTPLASMAMMAPP